MAAYGIAIAQLLFSLFFIFFSSLQPGVLPLVF